MIYFTKLQEEINSNDGAIGGHLSLVMNIYYARTVASQGGGLGGYSP